MSPQVAVEQSFAVDSADKAQRTGASFARFIRVVVVPLVIVLVGISVMLYPVVSTQLNNIHQRDVAQQYAELLKHKPQGELTEYLKAAEHYNATELTGSLRDPWASVDNDGGVEYNNYLSTLGGAYGTPMSQIIIPAAKVNLPIYHGTSSEVLDRGVGHLWGTALPVGGLGTHAVMTGHTGLTQATLFDNLVDVKLGDVFYINTAGRKMKYLVDDITVVKPEEVDSLGPVENRDLVTLITCTPYGINDHRLLVTGHRVPMDPVEEEQAYQAQPLQWQWWMKAILAFAAFILLLIVVLASRSIVRLLHRTASRRSSS